MFSVGLTGGIGSGKTTVADLFGKLGATIVDTDLIAHRITAPQGLAMPLIAREFGAEFVAADGSLDRAKMRALVFSDESARKRLEAITHPLIREETEREARTAQGAYIVFVVPLLVESGTWKTRVDRVLVVDCDVETQIARVTARNGFTRAQVEAIVARPAGAAARASPAAVAQRPFVQAAALRKAKADAHVPREIGELRRHAVLREIAGRRDERARERGRDLHAHHPGLQPVREADSGVEAFLDDVDEMILVADLDAHLRVAAEELGEHVGRHDRFREVQRADPQQALGFVARVVQRVARVDDLPVGLRRCVVIALAGFRQAHAARAAAEELHFQLAFELPDRQAHRGRRQAERRRRTREIAVRDDAHEYVQAAERIAFHRH